MGDVTTYLPCDRTLADCDPAALVTQMQEERGKFSHEISQRIQTQSNILKFAEKTKRPFPSGMGDYVKSMVLDIAQPSTRDVLDHQKRLASATPGNSPCDMPSRVIPYGSHTVEACLFGWAWETDWFCKFDLAYKHKREKQIGQIKQIMETWAAGIWSKWVWRSYQRCVNNYVLAASIPVQHGAAGYALINPTSILTIPWLDWITQRLSDAAGLIGSPMSGSWVILMGHEEAKEMFERYFQAGAQDYGVRTDVGNIMAGLKRYDADWGMNYYELNNYRIFCETRAPRFKDRNGGTWDDALIDDITQVEALYGTESKVSPEYRDPTIAKYSEALIFNEEAVHWLTPPVGFTEDNGFNKDRNPGYSYAGDFFPVCLPQVQDPNGRKVKYYSEYVAGMESIFPGRGAAILSLACHINPALETMSYTLTPGEEAQDYEDIQASLPILPAGTLQLQTRGPLPNVADGYRLFLKTAGDRVAKLAANGISSYYCEDRGYYLHAVTFDDEALGGCVPRECDPWKRVVVLPDTTADSALVDESGCELCGGATPASTTPDDLVITYYGDNIQGITLGTTSIEGTVAATLEADVQTELDSSFAGATITITEVDDLWTITITPDATNGPTVFHAYAKEDGGGISVFSSDPTESTVTEGTIFTVADNGTDATFASYAGEYYDSGENETATDHPVYTNGTRFAVAIDPAWDGAVMTFYPTLGDAQGATNAAFESNAAGESSIVDAGGVTEKGVQY